MADNLPGNVTPTVFGTVTVNRLQVGDVVVWAGRLMLVSGKPTVSPYRNNPGLDVPMRRLNTTGIPTDGVTVRFHPSDIVEHVGLNTVGSYRSRRPEAAA